MLATMRAARTMHTTLVQKTFLFSLLFFIRYLIYSIFSCMAWMSFSAITMPIAGSLSLR